MASPLGEFGKIVRHSARNPLGIIGLFIFLVYAIAGLALTGSVSHLNETERLPLIWFLVLFPVIILLVFFRLVTQHHTKLYAPGDFPDEEGFFRVLTLSEQKHKLDEEVQDVQAEDTRLIRNGIAVDETESDKVAQEAVTRQSIMLVEDLVCRELEREFGNQILRNVSVGERAGVPYQADGILPREGGMTIVEIKFTRSADWQRRAKHALAQLEHLPYRSPPLSFLIAIVAEGLNEEKRKSATYQIENLRKSASVPIELRVYDFGELKSKYGIA